MKIDVQKALKSPLILLSGDESRLKKRFIEQVFAALEMPTDDFDAQFFMADELSVADWIAAASTIPFLAPRRVVVLRNAQRIDLSDSQLSGLSKLPESALVLLVADEDASEERTRTPRGKSLSKLVEDAKGVVLEFKQSADASREEIRAEVQRHGKKIASGALDLLLEMTNESASRALEELEKIVLFASGETIVESDVRAVTVSSREWNIWRMIDSIIAGDVAQSMSQLGVILSNKAKVEDVAIGQIFPQLSRNFRLLWQARACIDAGCQPPNLTPQLAAAFPEKPNIAKEAPFRQRALMNSARKLSESQLADCFRILAEADARLKGQLTSFSGVETLERTLLEIAQVVQPRLFGAA